MKTLDEPILRFSGPFARAVFYVEQLPNRGYSSLYNSGTLPYIACMHSVLVRAAVIAIPAVTLGGEERTHSQRGHHDYFVHELMAIALALSQV